MEDPREKLYKSLSEKGLYTKSYEDFNTQFSNDESRAKLYSSLSQKGLYTKSQNDFNVQFFSEPVKKKEPTIVETTTVEPIKFQGQPVISKEESLQQQGLQKDLAKLPPSSTFQNALKLHSRLKGVPLEGDFNLGQSIKQDIGFGGIKTPIANTDFKQPIVAQPQQVEDGLPNYNFVDSEQANRLATSPQPTTYGSPQMEKPLSPTENIVIDYSGTKKEEAIEKIEDRDVSINKQIEELTPPSELLLYGVDVTKGVEEQRDVINNLPDDKKREVIDKIVSIDNDRQRINELMSNLSMSGTQELSANISKGLNQSALGLVYKTVTGDDLAYVDEARLKPSLSGDAIAFGTSIILDAPVFAFGGGTGIMAKNLTELGLRKSAEYMTEKLVASGIERNTAQGLLAKSMNRVLATSLEGLNAGEKIFAKNTIGGQLMDRVATTSGALGMYDSVNSLLTQTAGGKSLADVNYSDVINRGVHGAIMGAVIAPVGLTSSLVNKYIDKTIENKVGKLFSKTANEFGSVAVEGSLFTAGGQILSGGKLSDLTAQDYLNGVLMLGVAKGTGKVQELFKKSQNFNEDKINKDEFNIDLSDHEVSILNSGKNSVEAIETLRDKNKLSEILADEKVPLRVKQKILWATNGTKMEVDDIAKRVESKTNNDGTTTIETYNRNNELINSVKVQENESYDVYSKTQDIINENNFIENVSNLPTNEKYQYEQELKKNGFSLKDLEGAFVSDVKTPEQENVINKAKDIFAQQEEARLSKETTNKEVENKESEIIEQPVENKEIVEPKIKENVTQKVQGNEEIVSEIPQEQKQSDELTGRTPSGIKKSLVSEENKILLGVKVIEDEINKAQLRIESGEVKYEDVVNSVNAKPRIITPDETLEAIVYKRNLDKELDKIYDDISSAKSIGDLEKEHMLRIKLQELQEKSNRFQEFAQKTGYESGLAQRYRQVLFDSEYNLQTQIRRYKELNGGYIPKDVEKRFEQYDKELRDLRKKVEEYEINLEKSNEENAISAIKNASEKKDKSYDLSESEKKRLKELRSKFLGRLNDITGVAQLIADKEFYEYAKLIFKQAKGDFRRFSDKMMYSVGKGIKEHLPKLYSELGGKGSTSVKVDTHKIVDGELKIKEGLIRELVNAGVTDIDTLVNEVKKFVIDDVPDVTDRQIRDAITKYGKQVSMTQDEISKKIRELKRVGRLVSAIEDVKSGKRPLRSGLKRDKVTDEERRMMKVINDGLKDIPMSEAEAETAWKTSLESIKTRLRNRISDIQHRIETGEKPPERRKTQLDEEAVELKKELELLKEQLNFVEGKGTISNEQRAKTILTSLKNKIEEYQRRIDDADFAKKEKIIFKDTPEIKFYRERLSDLKSEYEKLKEDTGYAEKVILENKKKSINKSIEEYQRRIDEKDFAKKPTREINKDKELRDLELKRQRIKDEYEKEVEEVRLKNRGTIEKAQDYVIEYASALPRSLMASADFSAPLRQGLVLSAGYPKQASKAFIEMFRQAFGESFQPAEWERKLFGFKESNSDIKSRTNEYLQEVKSSDFYPMMKKLGLYIAEPSHKMSAREEQFMSNIAEKIPLWGRIVRGSNRAYAGFLNKLRTDVFIEEASKLKESGYDINNERDFEVYKGVADFINNATGRGDLGKLENAAGFLSATFFSPRLIASRINLLNPIYYAKMDAPARKMALRSVLGLLGTGLTILSLAKLNGFEVEDDPRSPDFGKIKKGDIRWDIWGGFQQYVRFFSQIISGERKSGDKIIKLDGEGYKSETRGDVATRFIRGKLSPFSAFMVNLIDGQKDMMGKEMTVKGEIVKNTVPLYLQDLRKIYEEDGIPTTAGYLIPSIFGVGVQKYAKKKESKKRKKVGFESDFKNNVDSGFKDNFDSKFKNK